MSANQNPRKAIAESPESALAKNFEQELTSALRKVLPDQARSYPLHEPSFLGNEWKYVKECLDTTFVSSVGKFVDRFETELAAYTGAKYAVAVVNGTAALHIALQLAGVRPGDEVLVPTLSFVATANAVVYGGATPHFVDSEAKTLGINAGKLREYLAFATEKRGGLCVNRATGKVIRAIVPMHTFGHPANMDSILALAHDYHFAVVEDAAEALGSTYHGRHTGTFGLLGTLSFNGNKIITTGGGGAILTDRQDLARLAKHITTTAKVPHAWEYVHDQVGFNYRLPNLNAALGCAQLEQLPSLLHGKRVLYKAYRDSLAKLCEVSLFAEPMSCQSNYWLQTLLLKKSNQALLNSLLARLHREKILARPLWAPLHQLDPFRACPHMDVTETEALADMILNLPSSPGLAQALPA